MVIPERQQEQKRTPQIELAENALQVLLSAKEYALNLNHNFIGDLHLLFGLTKVEPNTFLRAGVDPNRIRSTIEFILIKGEKLVADEQIELSARSIKIIEIADDISRYTNQPKITSEHLLAGIILEGKGYAQAMPDVVEFTRNSLGLVLARELYKKLHPVDGYNSDTGSV